MLGILYYVSSTLNPILYSVMSHRYRRALRDTVRRIKHLQRSTHGLTHGLGWVGLGHTKWTHGQLWVNTSRSEGSESVFGLASDADIAGQAYDDPQISSLVRSVMLHATRLSKPRTRPRPDSPDWHWDGDQTLQTKTDRRWNRHFGLKTGYAETAMYACRSNWRPKKIWLANVWLSSRPRTEPRDQTEIQASKPSKVAGL